MLIPDPLHCARYYNCSDNTVQQGLGIGHLQECKYPRLFGYGATSCQLFTEIQCETRYEPKAPCKYMFLSLYPYSVVRLTSNSAMQIKLISDPTTFMPMFEVKVRKITKRELYNQYSNTQSLTFRVVRVWY